MTTSPVVTLPVVERDGYVDSLHAIALVLVVTYHTFGWVWLPLVFPSMGVMFAVGGSLVAASLDRRTGQHYAVLHKRLRRLLPPLWALGLVLVPVMLLSGWSYEPDTGVGSPLSLAGLLAWLVPFSPPPGSAFGYEWIVPLWYVSTYLWFLLLSPALLCAFRLWGWRLLLMPLVGVVLYGSGTIRVQGGTDEVLFSLCTYGACWMLGFGHHDRRLRALSRGRTVVIGVALMAAGLAYAVTHRTAETGLHLSDIPVADALYGLGFTLILLRLSPSVPWRLGGWIGALVAAVNRRAMTIYLWGSACIWTAREIPHLVPMPDGWKDMAVLGVARGYLLTWVLVAGVVLVLGWVEDVAASRRPRISPLAPPTSRAPTRS